jgi:transposase
MMPAVSRSPCRTGTVHTRALVVHPGSELRFLRPWLTTDHADPRELGDDPGRALSEEEREALGRIARSRTVGAGQVRRAQIVLHALAGLKAPEISARMDLCGATVRHWLKRFNARGLQGLEEDVRSGRPPTYSAEQRSAVITAALTRPADLGLPFACWTLDRLVVHLSQQGIAMRRSRISEIFIQEGLKWRHEGGS